MNSQLLALLIAILLIAAVLILFLPTRQKADTPADRYGGDYVYRDDDRYWVGGFFYNNPDDLAMFVPKRYGMGWTPNFGNPKGRLIFIGMLLIPVAIAILGVLLSGGHPTGCHTFGCTP